MGQAGRRGRENYVVTKNNVCEKAVTYEIGHNALCIKMDTFKSVQTGTPKVAISANDIMLEP